MQRDQAHRTNELLERIAIALEKNNKKENGARVLVDELGTNNIYEPTSENPDPAGYGDEEVNDDVHKSESGDRILSCYKNAYKGRDIWIETHGYGIYKDVMDLDKYSVEDYNHTVIMFPEER